jgi:hypothetical protein
VDKPREENKTDVRVRDCKGASLPHKDSKLKAQRPKNSMPSNVAGYYPLPDRHLQKCRLKNKRKKKSMVGRIISVLLPGSLRR